MLETWHCMWCEQPACDHPTWRHRWAWITMRILNWIPLWRIQDTTVDF